ncbi:MAG: bifunctional DNA-formamidopyrimidine glycosylase/DNA-(apurinic or apyrimidinic site) lyase [candidate division Zixibacteria bacterium]|nr:bifunctional DNA-formamidopyrimidine glycosylase/DNA-(apurinic or apyrimidinic site) lyase [candidate division Zixibacteria bacterium]
MPELPEVETVVRGLKKSVAGETITAISIKPTARVFPRPDEFSRKIKNASFETFSRRGKNILLGLSNGYTLWVHLKMTGHFYYLPKSTPTGKHDHVVLTLKNNDHSLRFNDYRRFGYLKLFPTSTLHNQKGLAELGPEPLTFPCDEFVALCKSKHRMLKPALLDQTFIAGIGNIYADESLYLSRLHPMRLTDSVSNKKLAELHGHIQSLLKSSIKLMGTSVDTFAGVNGQPGKFQNYLKVYGRENKPCERCGKSLTRQKIGSRSAHFCPKCQRNSR